MGTMTDYTINSRPTADELRQLPVLSVGQADSLHYDNGRGLRFWVSRTTRADGEPFDSTVTVEAYQNVSGRWVEVAVYDGAGA